MKTHKFMNLFRSGLFCLFFMLAGNLLAENVTITIDVSSLSGTDGNYIWNSGGVSGVAKCKKENTDYLSFTNNSYELKNTSPLPGYIRSVKLYYSIKDTGWNLYVDNSAISTVDETKKISQTLCGNSNTTWTNISGCSQYFRLFFSYSKQSSWVSSIIITYEVPTLSLVAQQNETYYATFSNTQPTFFPSAEGVKIMTACVEGGKLNTSDINNDEGGVYVPANTGVLISSTSPTVNYLYSNNKEGKTVGTNMLHPATESMDADTNYYYKLAYDNYTNKTGLGFYWGAANGAAFDRKAGTAYLAVPKSSGAKGFHFDFDGETSVEALERSTPNVPVYNLQGQKVTDEYRGVYIRSGKKYFKK